MKPFLAAVWVVGSFLHAVCKCPVQASEFHLDGDYLLGGLFDIHHVTVPFYQDKPKAIDCSSKTFLLPNYRRFQLMRFTVEEINNSTSLLPNVTLGYEMFDHCSDTLSFAGALKLISTNNLIHPWAEPNENLSKVIAVVGPFTSTQALTISPFFMVDLIPLVSYGSSGSIFSQKSKYPSFLRTVHPNENTLNVIVNIIEHFSWRWVAFLNSDDDFGIDGLEVFRRRIKITEICLAYNKGLSENTDHYQMFKQIEAQNVNVIVVFAPKTYAEAVIEAAIQLNITNKVWIADDGWSLNKRLPKMNGIKTIGTVLGVAQPVITIPGFDDFISSTKSQMPCADAAQQTFCNQVCNCSDLLVEDIVAADPSFSFAVYSAVYAVAQALHNSLKCDAGRCDDNNKVLPYIVLKELRKSNFTLLNQSVQFDENGDPSFGSFSIVFWNQSGKAQEVGFHHFYPTDYFYINNSKIQWHTNGEVPTALCSPECPEGYARKQIGIHKCCFNCEICPAETYVNNTEDPFKCTACKETEWSGRGSTSCSLRLVEFIPFTDTGALVIMVGAGLFIAQTLAVCVLFAVNYNTPVVRSAGGPMCFLILVCLGLCTPSVFFYFGKPTTVSCILQYIPFILFYTVCLACFVVRSFQIVCIFKIAAKFPKLQSWWTQYHGQWLLITGAFATQALLLIISLSCYPPRPYNETSWYPEQIVLSCDLNIETTFCSLVLLVLLCCLCFIFSYMAKDLPKNYNEAKVITFCLLLLILTWIMFSTVYLLYRGKYIQTFNALAVLSSLYSFLLWYFLPKCYIIAFQPQKNTQQYFQGLIQNYTKTMSQ
ncbi:taste receptor type 1 member 1-like [Kryptolebias marmoratus]|uniref:Taste receptor type 1 member 1-like n=1 Tax=Kryptolebias marmoratus TaxID=37003 RepID=A0A3Q3ANR1_KRYMA|nr:taste receptor type 1 member 1-like [Kryptolebias marmoratus]